MTLHRRLYLWIMMKIRNSLSYTVQKSICRAIHYQLRSFERQRIPKEQLQVRLLEFYFCECPACALLNCLVWCILYK